MSGNLYARLNPLHAAPNLLTILRICLAPFLVSAILENRFGLSFALFVVAGLTDALDGTLARWLKQRTILGQYLDPVADKLLLSTLFLVLTHKNLIGVTVTALALWPRSGHSAGGGYLFTRPWGRREFRPSLFGKLNTVAQVAAVKLWSCSIKSTVCPVGGHKLRTVALEATVVLTVASGLHYAWMVTRRMAAPGVDGVGPGR